MFWQVFLKRGRASYIQLANLKNKKVSGKVFFFFSNVKNISLIAL